MATPTPRLDALKAKLKEHLRGVKGRLLQVFLAFGLGAGLSWYYRAGIVGLLIAPAHGRLSPTGGPVFTEITEVFNFTTHLALLGGVLAAAPVLAFHVFRIISPLLPEKPRRFLALFLPSALGLFLGGVVFSYFLVLPLVLEFMLAFGVGLATPMIGLTEYMDLAKTLLLGIGAVFEMPMVMYLLAKLRILSHGQMKRVRRFVPPMAFIFAGLISSTIEVTIPIAIIALYEVGLILMWLVERGQRRTERVVRPRGP